jgi:tetratricopeptide (TPR) repeat protein
MLTQHRPSGVPDGLPPDELESWSNELVAFLTSDNIPAKFRGWARGEADQLDAYMASADDLDAGFDGDEEVAAAPRAAAKPARQRPAKARRPAPAPRDDRMMVVQVPVQLGRLIVGVALGAVALLAIFGVHALTSGGDNASLPASAAAPSFDQARADQLQALLQQDPNNQDALFEIGEMNFQAARNEEAISWFTKLVALDPKNKHAMTDLGTANFNLSRPDLAKEWWQKVLIVDPNDVQAHYNMGFAYANRNT